MRLSMKAQCEKCRSELRADGEAYICSFECTFCSACAANLRHLCPNCGGELIRRPRRLALLPGGGNADSEHTRTPHLWLIWLLSFAVWILIALAAAISMYQIDRSSGRAVAFRDELTIPLINNLIFAFLTPLVFVKVLQFPIWENNRVRRVLGYGAGALGFTLAHVALRGSLYPVWDPRVKAYALPLFDPKTHAFGIQWVPFQRLFLYNVVDDIVSIYLLIVLVGHIVGYYQRLRERDLRTSQLETELAKAQLESLKTQLQPHFLFNTLHSISSLMLKDVGAADKMMTRLSDLLRMSLENRGIQITSLRRELEFVESYLEIEKIRFQDRLNVILDIAPDTLDAQVPHLLLQPLVENAVHHGISKALEPGRVRISASHDGRVLCLRVINDWRKAGPAQPSKGGVGLQATRGRLVRLYGNAQSFDVFARPNASFEVSIRIPFSTDDFQEGPIEITRTAGGI